MGAALRALASWWGYAEADPRLVGLVVAAVAIFAAVYVGQRLRRGRRRRRAR